MKGTVAPVCSQLDAAHLGCSRDRRHYAPDATNSSASPEKRVLPAV